MQKNQQIELTITGMTGEGTGVGHYDGMAVFVPFSAEGDVLRATVLKVKKSYAYAKIEQIITPSAHRIQPDCTVFGRCGGCAYRHITYSAELAVKEQRVRDALLRIGGISVPVLPILGSENEAEYRNKAQYPVKFDEKGLHTGFYAARSHRVVDCALCRLQPPVFDRAVSVIRRWVLDCQVPVYDEGTHTGLLRHIYLRYAGGTGEVMVCLVVNGMQIPCEAELIARLRAGVDGLCSVVLNINRAQGNVILGEECLTLWGKDSITDLLCGIRVRISPLSFYQVNRSQCERLYRIAAQFAGLTGGETVLDLYCGAGTIGLSMAGQAASVIGVEVVEAAVEDARENARMNGIENARFICADAADAARRLAKEKIRPDVILLDPPRKGCEEELLAEAVSMNPHRIVYISCDPATLARDLGRLAERGYAVKQVQPVDMFPRTAHVECVVLMTRA